MNKPLLMTTLVVATIALMGGCTVTMPVNVKQLELQGQISKATPPAPALEADVAQPTPIVSPPPATPTMSTSPTPPADVKGSVRVTGNIHGTNPLDYWHGPVIVNDKYVANTAMGKARVFDTVLTPEADGKTYLYANTTGIARGEEGNYKFGGNMATDALKWIKVEVDNSKPSTTVDLFMNYSIGHSVAAAPGTHVLSFPRILGETSRVITVAPMYKAGERTYSTPMRADMDRAIKSDKTWTVETDDTVSVTLENIEAGTWYAFQVKLALPNGEAETTVNSFLGGRAADTGLLGEDAKATPFDASNPEKVM